MRTPARRVGTLAALVLLLAAGAAARPAPPRVAGPGVDVRAALRQGNTTAKPNAAPDATPKAAADRTPRWRRRSRSRSPLRGVGGVFVILAIAVSSLVLFHLLLRDVSPRKAALLPLDESAHSFSEVYTTTQNTATQNTATQNEEGGGSQSESAADFRGFGRRLRDTLSFKKPDGSWVHQDSSTKL